MAVIDLGRVGGDGDDPPAARPRRLRRSERRGSLMAAVAVCGLLTVTGSERPHPGGLAELWDVPYVLDGNAVQVSGGDIFVLDHSGDRRLTAHDARTGAVRWSIDPGDAFGLSYVQDGALLVHADLTVVGSVDPQMFSRETVALDTATGRPRWRQPGEVLTVAGDRVLLAEWDENGRGARRIRMVGMRDGGTVWSRDRAGTVSWAVDTTPGARPDRLLTVTAEGRAEVIALADGSVLRSGALPRPAVAPIVTLRGRQIIQDQTVRGRTTITAYDVDTLRRLWTVEEPGGTSFDCGPVVCVNDGDSLAGHDRATGARLWRLPTAAGAYPLPGGRLLTEEAAGARHAVLDATTGARLAELGRGLPVWNSQGRLTYLIAGTLRPPGRTAVRSFDPAAAEAVLRGTITSAQTCRNDRDLLICVTEDSRLTVTALSHR